MCHCSEQANEQTRAIFLTKFLDALISIAERNPKILDAHSCWSTIEQMTLMQFATIVTMDAMQMSQLARLLLRLLPYWSTWMPDLGESRCFHESGWKGIPLQCRISPQS